MWWVVWFGVCCALGRGGKSRSCCGFVDQEIRSQGLHGWRYMCLIKASSGELVHLVLMQGGIIDAWVLTTLLQGRCGW